jgi:hypothetical protein
MTPEEFKRRYIANLPKVPDHLDLRLDEFCSFDPEAIATLRIPDPDKHLLSTVGLPSKVPSGFYFADDYAMFPHVDEFCGLPPEFSRYRALGFNDYGDMVCLDESLEGRLVYLNHDNDNLVVYINKNIRSFAQTICHLLEFDRDKNAAVFCARIAAFDPDALNDGAHWSSLKNLIKS